MSAKDILDEWIQKENQKESESRRAVIKPVAKAVSRDKDIESDDLNQGSDVGGSQMDSS